MIYFDYNSTAPILDSVKTEMMNLMNFPANPSSIHNYGRKAKYIIEDARRNIAKSLNFDLNKYDIVFTSGGTESNNLIMHNYREGVIITSGTEHLSILNCKDFCPNFRLVNILESGIIDLKHLESILETLSSPKNVLVSIIYANNETGIIQPIKEINELCRKYSVKFHTDAAQVIGKIKFCIDSLDIDFATISGHKFGGPVGVGFLIYRKYSALIPHIYGGGQEKNLRSGTENMIAIKGLEKALEVSTRDLLINTKKIEFLRNLLEDLIIKSSPDVKIIGKTVERLPNTSNLIMKDVASEKQLIEFDLKNIAISSGSACSSGKTSKSHVLKAMKLDSKDIDCSIRVSLGPTNNEDEVRKFVKAWKEIAKIKIN